MNTQTSNTRKEKLPRLAVLGVLGIVIAIVAIYVIAGVERNGETDQDVSQTVSTPVVSIDKSLATGQMQNFVFAETASPVPNFVFKDASGKNRSIKEWNGRVVLLNLWATWCAPCRKEMPDLARLATEFGGDQFDLVAISLDRKGVTVSGKFLKEVGAGSLALFADKSLKSLEMLKVVGLPTTLLLDRQGREIGRLAGPANWYSDDAKALIRAAIDAGPAG